MFNVFKSRQVGSGPNTLSPSEVQDLVLSGAASLVDVREVQEHQAERIPGSLNIPLSRFEDEAGRLPTGRVILHCLSGGRSMKALGLCARLGLPVDTHLGGGINAWKASGLPVER